jgi:IS605 OrfB family transposase
MKSLWPRNPSVDGGLAALVFDVRLEDFESGSANGTQKEAARRAIVIEDLGEVRSNGSKIRSYTERSQWAFYQLLQFILYKAALSGVEVIQVCPAYSSQECSRCHGLTKPVGKKFACSHCGHKDHRDANAAFTLALRAEPIGGLARYSEGPRSGILVDPFPGSIGASLGPVRLTTCQ